jgi:hypothetical protein
MQAAASSLKMAPIGAIMLMQHHTARADGSVLFQFTAGALAFDVLSTPAELERCCTFLKDASAATSDRISMGLFGPFEVLVIRGTDDWSVRVQVCTTTGEVGQQGQCISADIRRVVLLKALTQIIAPPEAAPEASHAAVPRPSAGPESAEQAGAESEVHPHTDRHILHTALDARRLVTYVATHWTVPHIEVALDKFAELDRQRAQTRITRLAGISEYQSLGAWAVVATVILGTIKIIWSFNDRTLEQRFVDTYVTSSGLWEYGLGLLVAAACAWFAGKWLGALWCRLRLLLALCRLWLRARALESAG